MDNNATTPVAPEVREAMQPFLAEDFGNASSIHWYGQRAKAAVETAREQLAALLHARPNDLVFTSGGTEADNMSILGGVDAAQGKDETKHLVVSAIEHHAVLHSAKSLERRGVAVTYVKAGASGLVNPADVERALRPNTVLVSVMLANNEIGTVQPLEEIGRITRERRVVFHTDAVQAVGKIPVDVEKLGVDLLSLSAHKLHGPKGVGALYVRKGVQIAPLFFGGHSERDRRPGTENTPGIVGLGKAAEIASAKLAEDGPRLAALRDHLEDTLLARIPQCSRNGAREPRLPSTANIRFDHVDGEGFVIAADLKGIACSTGAACSSGSVEPSHVLSAIGLSNAQARSSIRFSLGRMTAAEDIDYALEVIPAVVERLRSVSPNFRAVTSVK
ncbi:MAG: cysteine desulfurase family protein [Deltaproteobacteria bacterium]